MFIWFHYWDYLTNWQSIIEVVERIGYLHFYLVSWHQSPDQSTNFVSPNFFHEFFSVWTVKRDSKLFIGPNQIFSQFWANKAFVINWENFMEKISENKIRGLVARCNELIIPHLYLVQLIVHPIYKPPILISPIQGVAKCFFFLT